MTDQQLIDHCGRRCQAINCQFEGRAFQRMYELAGKPRAYAEVADLVPRKLYAMREDMQALVDFAFKRQARPAGGLKIEVGHAYRDVNGDVRYVYAHVKRFKSEAVLWGETPKQGIQYSMALLAEFKEWALEEVKS
ncbi:hypothetical protein [Noviherbaspirillum saxi]|nr:hypothetical protein [Noviherbaspirillum saxi]